MQQLPKKEIAVYTANIGGYDSVLQPICPLGNMELFMFSDVQRFKSGRWHMVPAKRLTSDPCRTARIYKWSSHKLFPDRLFTVWVDSNTRIHDDFSTAVYQYMKNYDLAVCIHPAMPNHNCLYKEAAICKRMRLDKPEVLDAVVARYKAQGFPAHWGLPETSFIIRRNNSAVKKFNEMMLYEMAKGSRRDQVHFSYCAWKLKLNFCYIKINSRFNRYFAKLPHLHPRGRRK